MEQPHRQTAPLLLTTAESQPSTTVDPPQHDRQELLSEEVDATSQLLETADGNSSQPENIEASVVGEDTPAPPSDTVATKLLSDQGTDDVDTANEVAGVEVVEVVEVGGAESDDEEKRAILAEENILVLEEAEKVRNNCQSIIRSFVLTQYSVLTPFSLSLGAVVCP